MRLYTPAVLALQWGPFGVIQSLVDDFAGLDEPHAVVWKEIDDFNNMTTMEYQKFRAIVIPDATLASLPDNVNCRDEDEILSALSRNGKLSYSRIPTVLICLQLNYSHFPADHVVKNLYSFSSFSLFFWKETCPRF